MNISRQEQRALHAMAQGGAILIEKMDRKIVTARCVNREGWVLSGFTLLLFKKLKKRGLIASKGGGPYRITRRGLFAVRAQMDNR